MYSNLVRYRAFSPLVAVCLIALHTTATAGSFTRGCAARDMQVLMLVEQHENVGAISAERSTDAIIAMFEARMVCHEGRVLDALALYDRIANSLTVQFGEAQ